MRVTNKLHTNPICVDPSDLEKFASLHDIRSCLITKINCYNAEIILRKKLNTNTSVGDYFTSILHKKK